jgi:FkbM family methyltransferase|tara:strand:- start:1373 stop:2068 length:696 start_codon:yes stop_codon:yes gene_type:complete
VLYKIKKLLFIIFNLKFFKAYLNSVFPLIEISNLLNELPIIDNCIDVGSNKGQFALILKRNFPKAKIFSFEPQIENLSIQKKFLNNTKFYNCCLGNKSSFQIFNITDREDSSSLLVPSIFKNSIYRVVNKITIKVDKLDNIIKLKHKSKNLLKLDVQGYELEVLKGSKKCLSKIDFIIIELGEKKSYLKQPSKNKTINFLKKNNFQLKKISNKTKLNNSWEADYLFVNMKK